MGRCKTCEEYKLEIKILKHELKQAYEECSKLMLKIENSEED